MILVLVKNELIKILKKTKTKIVFGLFLVFLGVCTFALYNESKYMEKSKSLDYKIQQNRDSIKYTEEQLAKAKKTNDKEFINILKKQLNEYEEERIKYEDQLNNSNNVEQWKVELDEEIKNNEANLKSKDISEEDKTWIIERIEKLKYLRENNIKPLYGYEFNAYNYIETIMSILGTSILAIGIAIFMGDIVSGEYKPGTFKLLLTQPVSRGKIILSKFIAGAISSVMFIISGEMLVFLGVGFITKFQGATYPQSVGARYFLDTSNMQVDKYSNLIKLANTGKIVSFNEFIIKSILLQILFIITCCAVFFLISTIFKSSGISVTLSIIIATLGTVIFRVFNYSSQFAHLSFLSYSHVTSVISGEAAYIYKNVNITIGNGIVVMIVTSIISCMLAQIIFNKKEMLI